MPDVTELREEELDLSGLQAGFLWGAATSAFQVEGSAVDRGRSIWDRFCSEPGRVADGSDGLVACDHVGRYTRDVALMRELGLDAYRFSIAWTRVQPGGRGRLARAGLGFYDRLVDELLAAGVVPWASLYHWDLPEELQTIGGGWAGRGVVDAFADYAVAVHAALGDRVRFWTTLDGPWSSAWLGHGSGVHAPGVRNHARAARAAHHLVLAHGRALAGMRAQAPADHRLGIALDLAPVVADPRLPENVAARLIPEIRRVDATRNRWWLDALLTGSYPDDGYDLLERHLDGIVCADDLAEISQPLDFLGVDYDSDLLLAPADQPGRDDAGPFPGAGRVRVADRMPGSTATGRPVTPDGLRRILVRVSREYPDAPPIVVTGNGSAWVDPPEALAVEGPIPDPWRIAYLRAHLDALTRAVAEGIDVRGYFAGSLLDGFAWEHGYTQRFGLVRVDYATLERRRRTSFEAYREIIASTRRR